MTCRECGALLTGRQRVACSIPCREKSNAQRYHKNHVEQYREGHLRRRYGLTVEIYKQMLEQQHYVCAICNREDSLGNLSVDHDHETGKVRALLCRECNSGLGKFDDDAELLERAARYVRLFQTETTSVKETS